MVVVGARIGSFDDLYVCPQFRKRGVYTLPELLQGRLIPLLVVFLALLIRKPRIDFCVSREGDRMFTCLGF